MSEETAEYLDRLRRKYLQPCVYCGEPGTTRDHVPPRSLGFVHKTYDACRECNCKILRAIHYVEIPMRARVVADWLKKQPKTPQLEARIRWAEDVARGVKVMTPRTHNGQPKKRIIRPKSF